ncbi:MAG: acyl-CoA-binding protein [Bdellovibrionaceae bacterium]|nr:acyl-CoA-binding protein [Pseudobdellovibrionaceae bacterium]|tara:strand:- start:947 stop:1213 length:267 start_codon:yes stop_codon:yes gene_type:complete
MSDSNAFQQASEDVKNLKQRPGNDDLLSLYALFKQATDGDVAGKRPGMLDIKGRAKYDAWAKLKGKNPSDSQAEYIQLVESLKGKYGF